MAKLHNKRLSSNSREMIWLISHVPSFRKRLPNEQTKRDGKPETNEHALLMATKREDNKPVLICCHYCTPTCAAHRPPGYPLRNGAPRTQVKLGQHAELMNLNFLCKTLDQCFSTWAWHNFGVLRQRFGRTPKE